MDNVDEILARGVVNVIPGEKELRKALESGKKLNVYLGIDPTATRIHVGHAVPLRKLQAFVEEGHNVTFLIGDFTALIGDTSDKNAERPILTYEEIEENFKNYKKQASKIVDFSKVDLKFNGKWLRKLSFEDILKLTRHFSVGDFVSRELIRNRIESGKRVRLDEMLYPVMQGYDSYFMDTDVQIGSADQTFNMQAGRTLQKDLRDKESFVLVTDYIMGTDGRKMSKSEGNAIWLEDEPNEMFGKVMSVDDDVIEQYLTLATKTPLSEIEKILNKGPMEAKKELAFRLVSELHSEKEAEKAKEYFEKTFQGGRPDYSPKIILQETFAGTVSMISGASISEAKRLIGQGAVDVNGETITDFGTELKIGDELKVGKKAFGTVTEK